MMKINKNYESSLSTPALDARRLKGGFVFFNNPPDLEKRFVLVLVFTVFFFFVSFRFGSFFSDQIGHR